MPYHKLKCKDFLENNVGLNEKIYLLGDSDKIAEIYITHGTLMYDYKIVIKNFYKNLWFLLEDNEGDQYSLICLLKGTHTTNYNSTAPELTEIYVKGDVLEKYQDLRLSRYED